jgi:hypothetical protein
MSTLAQLVSSVRRALSDFNERASASDTGDGSQTVFRLPDQNIIGPETVLASTALAVAAQTVTTNLTDPPYVAVVSIKGGAAGMAGNVVVTGTDWQGDAATSTIALNGTAKVNGTQKFKTITSILLPAYTNGITDTVTVTSAHSLSCTVASVANTSFILDFDTGWFQFDSAPADAAAIVWNYQFAHWSKADIVAAINFGIDALYPYFYVTDLDTTTVSTVSSTYEYALPALTEVVTGVEWRESSSYPWKRLKLWRYSIRRDGTTGYLQFHDNPSAGSVRLSLIKRAARLVEDTDSTTDLGLPSQAEQSIIFFACWNLLTNELTRRVRSDQAVATMGEGVPVPDQFQRAISAFRFAYEMSLKSNRMRPWAVR